MQFNVQWPELKGHTDPRWCWNCLMVPVFLSDMIVGQCPHCGSEYAHLPLAGTRERLRLRIEGQEEVVADATESLTHKEPLIAAWAKERLPQAKKLLQILRDARTSLG